MTAYHDNGTHIKKAFHKIIHSEDTWDLCLVHHHTPDYLRVEGNAYIHHYCKLGGCFTATRDTYSDLRWPCIWCEKPVPEGLQALYVLLTGDMET